MLVTLFLVNTPELLSVNTIVTENNGSCDKHEKYAECTFDVNSSVQFETILNGIRIVVINMRPAHAL